MKVKDIKIGETYNNIQVLADLGSRSKSRYYLCKCILCGKELEKRADHIGNDNSCRQCSSIAKIVNLKGRRFGRLVALEYVGRKNDRTLWKCKCDCGKEAIIGYTNLVIGNTRSCGCMEEENRQKNRIKMLLNNTKSVSDPIEFGIINKHPLYSIWSSMLIRCNNSNRKSYKHYGGRGIKVCERWQGECGFENFIEDVGKRPSPKHSIDRIDYNGDYCPENCRWATTREQAGNRRDNSYLYIKGKRIIAQTLCDLVGLDYSLTTHRIQRGYDINLILKYKDVDLRTKEMRLIRDKCKNFNRVISEEFWHLIPKEVYNNLLNI